MKQLALSLLGFAVALVLLLLIGDDLLAAVISAAAAAAIGSVCAFLVLRLRSG
jgi:hypothetical protein